MSGRHSRNKGANYEREVAKKLTAVWPEARRGLGQARSAGEVADVTGTPYWIECKRHKRVSIQAAYEQAVLANGTADGVLVFSKDDRGRELVTMSIKDFMKLSSNENP